MRRVLWISAVLVPLLTATMVPPSILIWIGDGITQGGGNLVAVIGLYPPDIIRILIVLMAFHYALELPRTITKARVVWNSQVASLRKAIGSINVLGHFAIRVAVPVLFCLIVEGGPHFLNDGGGHVAE